MKLNKLMKVIIPTALLALASSASAAFISGSIAFSGGFNTTPTVNDLLNATGLTFSGVTVTSGTQFGDYASVPNNQAATFNPLTFSPPTVGVQLWTFTIGATTYSFDIGSMGVMGPGPAPFGGGTSLALGGHGTAYITGFDPTPGRWQVTANQNRQSLSFSSGADVPDGGTSIALLGASLLGLAGLRRKFRA